MWGSGVALAYVAWRTTVLRLRRTLRSPLQVALAAAGVAAFTTMQMLALRAPTGAAVGEAGRDAVVAAALGILAVVAFSATFQCPLRLRGADIAWLFPCPGGPRALLLRHVTGTTWVALAAAAGVLLAGVLAGGLRSGAVEVPLAAAAAALGVRAVSTAVYLLRLRLVDRRILRVVAPLALLVAAAPAAGRAFGFADAVPAMLAGATAWARHAVAALVDAVLTAGAADDAGLGLSLAAAVVLGFGCVAAGRGFVDDAARATWEVEAARSMLSDPDASKAVADLASKNMRQGVPSFERLNRMRGDAAFVWKDVAAARRSWRAQLRGLAPFFAVAVVLSLWAPAGAFLPAVLVVVIELLSSRYDGMPAELDRAFVHTVPGTPWRRLLAVEATPALLSMLGAGLVWLPVLVLSGLPVAVRFGGLAAVVVGAALVPVVSGLAAVTVSGALRHALAAAAVMGTVVALAAGATLASNVLAGVAVAVAAAIACTAVSAHLLPRRTT